MITRPRLPCASGTKESDMSAIVVTQYREADEFLRNSTLRQGLYDEGAILMKDVLVNLFGEEHAARRHLAQKLFRRDYFRNYERNIFPRTIRETLAPFVTRGGGDLADFGYHVLMNLTADASGIDRPQRSTHETATLLRMIRTFSKAATLGQITTGDPVAIRQEISDTLEEFDQTFFGPSERRRRDLIDQVERGEMPEGELPRDLLTILMQNEDQIDLPRDKLMKETAYFLFVGALSSTHALTHVMHHVFAWRAAHPEDEERLMHEAAFLQRCVWEALRLHPPTPELSRKLTCPVRIKSRPETFEGGDLTIDMFAVNQDPAMFGAHAAEFNPHRAAPPQGWLYGVTFGLGTHACLGRILVAGTPIEPGGDLSDAEFGNLYLIVRALLDHGARPDPAQPATMDTTNTRRNWLAYPFLLDRA
jgi:cytochrome P450